MDYDNASDFDLNKAVADALGYKVGHGWVTDLDGIYPYIVTDDEEKKGSIGLRFILPDYCNNWSDTGPILIENDIVFERRGFGNLFSAWHRKHISSEAWMREHSTHDNNVLRAICIVFLKLKEQQ